MSFGFGVGDFLAVGKLAWTVYKSCRDAPESFRNISLEVLSLHAVLKEVEEILAEEPLTGSRKQSLATVTNGCKCVLDDLKALVDKYEGMGSKSKITWDRMKWGANDITELRARLTSNTVLLTAFMSTSQVVVEKQLKKLIREFQEGKHEGSIKTIATVDSLTLDDKQTWRAIRKEFETIGISVAAFDANKGFIMGWFQQALESGAFEECMVEDDEKSISSQDTLSSENLIDYEPTNSTPTISHTNIEKRLVPTSSASTPPPTPPNKRTRELIPTRESPAPVSSQIPFDQTWLAVDSISEREASSAQDKPELIKTYQKSSEQRQVVAKKQPRVVTLFAWALRYDKAFHQACRYGDIGKAKLLLGRGIDVNSLDTNGDTALAYASFIWRDKVVAFLLENGADVNIRCPLKSALEFAVGGIGKYKGGTHPGAEVCRLLLKYGAALDTEDSSGRTPLCIASSNGHLEIVRTLLDHGANSMKGSPLACAVKEGDIDVARLILNRQAWKESDKRQEIDFAFPRYFSRTRFDTLRSQSGEDLRKKEKVSIISMLRLLLEHGANPNSIVYHGEPPLYHALAGSWVSVAKLLLEHGANPSRITIHGYSALYCALSNGMDEVAQLLIKRGASIKVSGETLVSKAVLGNCRGALKIMLEAGADVEEKNAAGYAALDVAVCMEDLTIAQLLVSFGATNNHEKWASSRTIFGAKTLEGYQRFAVLNHLISSY